MAVRGPAIPAGGRSKEIVGNIDIAPTALGVAGAEAGFRMDGRSLRRFWRDSGLESRRPVGLSNPEPTEEALEGGASVSNIAPLLRFGGFMVGPYKYFRYYDGGEAELPRWRGSLAGSVLGDASGSDSGEFELFARARQRRA